MGRLIDADYIDERIEDELGIGADRQEWYEEIINHAPTVEAIPQADYENRLKADMVAMLEELQSEIEDLYPEHLCTGELTGFADAIETIAPIIQQKIDKLKGVEE